MRLRKWLACICARKQDCRLGKAIPAMYHNASCIMHFSIKGKTAHGSKPHLGANVADALSLSTQAVNMIQCKSGNLRVL